ncbi:ureidoglycolate lyase [Consotaella salsifontis]|uniref:Ureidoglycolate lyase n=1 Tax=Consotaella salsifontis TaxID=1365950 RepID=A0A1T4SRA8_9HYPH|nr:ureidoglycolate lyase [Consotaella salsifontis]SKA30703.1 ureidoglycolate lyase [Consotaella salsifontis]
MKEPRTIRAAPLTSAAFAPFGDVIEADNAREIRLINKGTTTRFHDVASVDVTAGGGSALISIFRGKPFRLPFEVRMMERHPFGSQAFFPMSERPYLVVVAPDESGRPGAPLAFLVTEKLGVNYARNVWHHPLIALEDVSDFLVVDRGGPGANLQEAFYPEPWWAEA